MEHLTNNQAPNAQYADVYVAPLPERTIEQPLYPPTRQSELDTCKSERVKREKYFVWKLLAYAIKQRYSKDLSELHFEKIENGKWSCDLCEFSLSHSKNALCVAISDAKIGVDIERIPTEPPELIVKKILTEESLERYHGMPQSKKCEFFTTEWTRRESLFKYCEDKASFTAELPKDVPAKTQALTLGNEDYILCVTTDRANSCKIHICDL
jgi:phosphopantetheinyl transferase